MSAEVTYGDEFPEPYTFCPTGGKRALIVLFGIQSVLVVLLVAVGISPFNALVVAVGLLVIDALIVGPRLPRGQAVVRTVLVVLRALLSTEWGTAR